MNQEEHCDEFIHDHRYPVCLRYWLLVNRLPAIDKVIIVEQKGEPECYATWKGTKRVRLTMASRFGDVGITTKLEGNYGYEKRVPLSELSDFSDTPQGHRK